jgi:hypothetical protein
MSERMVKELNLEPIARMVTYATGKASTRASWAWAPLLT